MAGAADIELLILDVDGVLTDGSIWYDDAGQELKRFHVRDGSAIKAWMRLGFHVGVITGRGGAAVIHRMRDLGVTRIVQRCEDKLGATRKMAGEVGVAMENVACIGDDWADLRMMREVGFAISVADGDAGAREAAAFVTRAGGGQGAVREAIEHLLEAKGLLDKARDGA